MHNQAKAYEYSKNRKYKIIKIRTENKTTNLHVNETMPIVLLVTPHLLTAEIAKKKPHLTTVLIGIPKKNYIHCELLNYKSISKQKF